MIQSNGKISKIWAGFLAVMLLLGLILRMLPFLKYGFLYGIDSLGHFWFSEMIISSGSIFSGDIDISYYSETGWYTGYAAWFGLHVLEASVSMICGLPLDKIFLNIITFFSFITILPIYLTYKNRFKLAYQRIALIITSSLWFYFIFYTFIGSYETLGIFFFMVIVYLNSSEYATTIQGKLLVLLFLTSLCIIHHLSLIATLVYLSIYYLKSDRDHPLFYVTYTILLSFFLGVIYSRLGIFYLFNLLGYPILAVPPLLMFLKSFWKEKRIQQQIETLLYDVRNIPHVHWIFVVLFLFTVLLVIRLRYLFIPIHYIFGLGLFSSYVILLTPLILILIYQVVSRASNCFDEIIYTLGILVCFCFLGIATARYFLICRALGFISPFLIVVISSFAVNKKKLMILFLTLILSLYPVIPSYFYSDQLDRPYYPISAKYYATFQDMPYAGSSENTSIIPLVHLTGKYENASGLNFVADETGLHVTRKGNVIYQVK